MQDEKADQKHVRKEIYIHHEPRPDVEKQQEAAPQAVKRRPESDEEREKLNAYQSPIKRCGDKP